MSIPVKAEVEGVLDPLRPAIVDIMRGAWSDWLGSPYPGQWEHKRTRANFVWAQMAVRARDAWYDHPSIHIFDRNETLKFLANDRVLFRLKKGDENGIAANIPTQEVLAYHDHGQDLFGLPEVHRVDVVYQLNVLETHIRDIMVVARDDGHVVWAYSLLESADGVEALPMPTTEPPAVAPARRLVRARLAQPNENAKPRR